MSELLFGVGEGEFDTDSDDQGYGGADTPRPTEETLILHEKSYPLHSSIERVQRYATSELVIHRLSLVRDLVDYAHSLQYNDVVTYLIPVLQKLTSGDEAAVRQGIAEQLPELCEYLKEKGQDAGYKCIINDCLPVLANLLKDPANQVREASVASLLEIAPLFTIDDLLNFLLPLVKSMATDQTDEDNRVQSAQMLNELSPTIGAELTKSFALPLLSVLSEDAMFRVRKAVASSINLICETIGLQDTTSLILPMYIKLTKDEIWGVRKACVDSLVALSKNVEKEKRMDVLVPFFDEMVADKSRWVRSAAFEALGPFIATFPQKLVPQSLLNHYRNLATGVNADSELGDSDYVTFYAFNFPAVLWTVGPEYWPQLRDTYLTLTKDQQWKVRRTLAFSLHVVADILGEKTSEENLLPTFELFLKDLDEVKVGVIKHFAKFLRVLSPATRKQYFHILDEIQKNTKNWRFRRLLARQMGDLAELFDAQTVQDHILPLTMKIITDPVAHVRQGLHSQLVKVINSLNGVPEKREAFLQQLRTLATHDTYQMRLLFTKLAASSVGQLSRDIFERIFFEPLLQLGNDKVHNIKMFVGVALREIAKHESYKDDTRITETLNRLRSEKDSDIVIFAGGLPLNHPLIENTTSTTTTTTTTTQYDNETLKTSTTTPDTATPMSNTTFSISLPPKIVSRTAAGTTTSTTTSTSITAAVTSTSDTSDTTAASSPPTQADNPTST